MATSYDYNQTSGAEAQRDLDPLAIRAEQMRAGLNRITLGAERMRRARDGMKVAREGLAGHLALNNTDLAKAATSVRYPESSWAHRLQAVEAPAPRPLTETEQIAADYDQLLEQMHRDTEARMAEHYETLPSDPVEEARAQVKFIQSLDKPQTDIGQEGHQLAA